MLHMADTNSKSTIKTVEKSQACYRPLIQQNIGFISDVFFTVFRNFDIFLSVYSFMAVSNVTLPQNECYDAWQTNTE